MKKFLCCLGFHKFPEWNAIYTYVSNTSGQKYKVKDYIIQTRTCEYCKYVEAVYKEKV